MHPQAFGCIPPISASVFTWLLLCLGRSSFVSCKDAVIGLGATLTENDLTSRSLTTYMKTLFPDMVLFTCSGGTHLLGSPFNPLSVYKIILILGDYQDLKQIGTDNSHVGGGLVMMRTLESPGKDQGLASSESELFHHGACGNSHSTLSVERDTVPSPEVVTLQSWLFWDFLINSIM